MKSCGALADTLKNHALLQKDQKNGDACRLWYFDPSLMTENHPYSQHNVYLKPGVFDKVAFGNARTVAETIASDTDDVFMTFDAGVGKAATEIKKAASSMNVQTQGFLLIPSEACLQKRRDMMRATRGAQLSCV